MFDKLFDSLDKAQASMNKMHEARKLRAVQWLTEMCLKYNKKPEEVVKLMKESAEAFTKK